jgi:hypothetical protein
VTFFDLRAFLGLLKLLFSVLVCGQIQKSHNLSVEQVIRRLAWQRDYLSALSGSLPSDRAALRGIPCEARHRKEGKSR